MEVVWTGYYLQVALVSRIPKLGSDGEKQHRLIIVRFTLVVFEFEDQIPGVKEK